MDRGKSRLASERGFTLVELLVVIVILAILAAIALPLFIKNREKAWRAQVESALKDAQTSLEAYATRNDGVYTGTTIDELRPGGVNDEGLNFADTVTMVLNATADTYCIDATHANLDLPMRLSSSSGKPEPGSC